ncbi:MAG: hypothetical protein ACRCR2_02205 [Fusobacteriaceae bacterium]
MKALFATASLAITTLFQVIITMLECMGILSNSAKHVSEVVEVNAEAFKIEETMTAQSRIKQLKKKLEAEEQE